MKKSDIPKHYELKGVEPYESIDFIRAVLGHDGFIQFCHGNAIKYLVRAGKKDDYFEDIKKAQTYLGWIKKKEECVAPYYVPEVTLYPKEEV